MNLCSGGGFNSHDEVCYEGKSCPVCEQKDVVSEKETEIENLEKKIRDKDDEIYKLENPNESN